MYVHACVFVCAQFDVVCHEEEEDSQRCVCVCVCVRACVRVGVFAHFKHVVLEHVGSPAFGCR